MKSKSFRVAIIIVILQIILSFYLGLSLADDARIPSHWNIRGEIDGWSSKWTAILLFPGVNLLILLLAIFFPTLSPRYQKDPQRFQAILPPFISILVFFFAIIHIYTLLLAKGSLPMRGNFILAAIGMMFICLGNLLPKIPANFYLGVRLPWTLSSDIVWRKTHRVAGWSFFFGGLVLFLTGFLNDISLTIQIVLIITFLFMISVPILAAFIFYKKQK